MLFQMMFSNLNPSVTNLAVLLLFLLVVLWRHYTLKYNAFAACQKVDNTRGAPLTFPYVFPLLGSLPIAYLWKPRDFVLNRR